MLLTFLFSQDLFSDLKVNCSANSTKTLLCKKSGLNKLQGSEAAPWSEAPCTTLQAVPSEWTLLLSRNERSEWIDKRRGQEDGTAKESRTWSGATENKDPSYLEEREIRGIPSSEARDGTK